MALSAARKKIPNRGPIVLDWGYFTDTGKTFYANALVATFGGYLRPCTGAPGEKVAGVVDLVLDESVVTAGSAGATTPVAKLAVKTGIFGFAIGGSGDALTQAHVGRKVYAMDDTTVGLLPTGGRPVAGLLMEIEGTTAWVSVTGDEAAASAGTAWQGFGSTETVAAPGAISVLTHETLLSAIDGTDPFTLADGLFIGQEKVIRSSTTGANTPIGTVTPATPRGFATITAFGVIGDMAVLGWTATGWMIRGLTEVTVT